MTNNIKPFPVSMEAPDDRLLITMSDGNVVNLGRLSGYPGTQMSELGVDDLGNIYWTDPLGEVTLIDNMFSRIKATYQGMNVGLYNGISELGSVLSDTIDRNITYPSDAELIYLIPSGAKGFPKVEVISPLEVRYPGVATLKVNSILNGNYSIDKSQSYTQATGNYDGILWAAGNSVRYLTFEFDTSVSFSGFNFTFISNNYRPRHCEVQVSDDGVAWNTVYLLNLQSESGIYRLDRPYPCKYIRLMETGDQQYFEISAFQPFMSKKDVTLTTSTVPFLDTTAVELIEDVDHFRIEPLFNVPPQADTFNPYITSGAAIYELRSGMLKDRKVGVDAEAINPDTVVSIGEGSSLHRKAIRLEVGHYFIDFTSMVVSTSNLVVTFGLYDTYTETNIDASLDITTAQSDRSIDMVNGRFEFYNAVPRYVQLRCIYSANNQIQQVDPPEVRCRMSVLRVSETPLGNVTVPGMAITHKNIFSEYDIENELKVTASQAFSRPATNMFNDIRDTQGSSATAGVTTAKDPVVITWTFPEARKPIGWSINQLAGVPKYAPKSFSIEVLVKGYWVAVVEVNNKVGEYPIDGIWGTLDLDQAYTHWRLVVTETGHQASLTIRTFKLHSDELIRNPRISGEVLNVYSNNPSREDVWSGRNESVNIPTTTASHPLLFRADDRYNLWMRFGGAIYSLTLNSVSLLCLDTGETIELSATWDKEVDYVLVGTDLPPGLYRVILPNKNQYVRAIYLEEIL